MSVNITVHFIVVTENLPRGSLNFNNQLHSEAFDFNLAFCIIKFYTDNLWVSRHGRINAFVSSKASKVIGHSFCIRFVQVFWFLNRHGFCIRFWIPVSISLLIIVSRQVSTPSRIVFQFAALVLVEARVRPKHTNIVQFAAHLD
ncbi:unnamed protein product [Larinioides sclopetarius]|uniref:Uncharacterized protein n=1 Tax=Larinioides sclopetarius TaxID=280406 RepID=A0AAV2AU33_9ARAC